MLLLLVLLFSQAKAGDLNTDLGSPSACTKTQSDNGKSAEVYLYGFSSLLSGVLGVIPGAEPLGAALAVVNTIWVRKHNKP